jgi:hypothetical protein
MSTFLASLAGVTAANLEQGANSARHAGEMAEIAADNATAAANNAARLSKDAFDAAIQSAANGKMAVEEGREHTREVLDQLSKGVKEYIMPAVTENSSAIAALTDLVKADIQQNKGINARLDRIEQQLKSQINQAE